MDEFSLMDILSWMSGIDVPEPLAGLEDKEVIHKMTCSVDSMKDTVAEILGI
jgi:threonine synthase